MRKILPYLTVALILCGYAPRMYGQSGPCPPPRALMATDDPAYQDAMEMKTALESSGLEVRCVFPTKWGSQFMVWEHGVAHSTVEGEACIRTVSGDIGVLFLPKPGSFSRLKIKEERTHRGYLYRFSGMPGPWKVQQVGSTHRTYFFKNNNYILSVSDDSLRDQLAAALHVSPERM
ncbi:MAG TPA: hypothetical protein VJQ59_00405 [Candidatus Sulfotelmatobacter sp.]|nr:hypothetical protein [Candidatus Sulfotelmatobacter sp.]